MRLLLVTGTLFFGFSSLDGINTSSVFSADVKKGDPSMEYRSGYDPDSNDFAHRIHYQYGFSESWRMRLILLQSKNALDDLSFGMRVGKASGSFSKMRRPVGTVLYGLKSNWPISMTFRRACEWHGPEKRI